MDFLEDLEMYGQAMENAYALITKKKTLDDIYFDLEDEEYEEFYLPFDPITENGRTEDIIDMVMEYYITTEDYEKCSELLKIKNKCLKIQIESDQQQ
tara:strand:+ start:363 stop:653 length:291 start_codon:yes stop_codon:yes gene_type:complete